MRFNWEIINPDDFRVVWKFFEKSWIEDSGRNHSTW